jgi:hypothetical protein
MSNELKCRLEKEKAFNRAKLNCRKILKSIYRNCRKERGLEIAVERE